MVEGLLADHPLAEVSDWAGRCWPVRVRLWATCDGPVAIVTKQCGPPGVGLPRLGGLLVSGVRRLFPEVPSLPVMVYNPERPLDTRFWLIDWVPGSRVQPKPMADSLVLAVLGIDEYPTD